MNQSELPVNPSGTAPLNSPAPLAINAISIEQGFSGPLPPPDALAAYEKIMPGSAERIFVMAEKEQEHRISLENYAVKEQLQQSHHGQNYALIISLAAFLVSAFLAYTGHEVTASIIAGIDLIGLTAAFITGKILTPQGNANQLPQ